MQRRYHRPVLECLEDRLTPSTVLYSNHYTDVVVDNARQLLYLLTTSGTVERYDLAQKQFLEKWTVGYSLSQGDITPDGKYLVVGDSNPFGRFGVVDQIDLATGQVTNLTYSLSIYHSDPIHDLVMTSATHGYLTTGGFRTNDTGEFRDIDLTSGTVTLDPSQPYNSGINSLRRSEDYQTVYLTHLESLTRIDIATQQRSTLPVLRNESNNALALNHDGTMMAYAPTYGGLSIFDAQGKAIKTLNTAANGLYFDPSRSRLYLGNNGTLKAYNTITWQQEFAIPLLFSDGQPTLSEAMTTQGDYYFRLTSDFLFIQEIPTSIGALHHFDISVSSTLAPAGTPLTVTVTARDIYGQVKTDYQGSVSFASDDLQAQLPGGYTFQPSDAGQHQFVVTYPVPGDHNLKVRDDLDPGKRGVQEGIVAHSGHANFLDVPYLADTAFDPAGQLLYLASQNGLLYRFDLTTQTMLTPWDIGILPGGMDFSLDGRYLYVTDVLQNMVQADVLRIDLTNGQIQTIWYDLRQPVYWYSSSTDIATMYDGTALLVGAGGNLYHLDNANHITLDPWSYGDTEYTRVEPTYDRKQALLERFGFESIYHQDTGRIDWITGVVPLTQVTNRTGTFLPVKSFDNSGGFNIAAIDLHENPVVNHVEAGSPGAFDPLLNWFYVNQNDDGWVVAYDLATGEAVQGTPLKYYYDPFGVDLVSRISPDRRWYLVPNRSGVHLADWQQATTAQLGVVDTQVLEGTGGSTTVQVHVRLSEPLTQEVTVQYETQGNTAGGYSDYTTISGTLHFAPGELEKIVTISINPDDIYEQDQKFSLVLSKPVNAFVGAHQRGWITILDDDAVPVVEFLNTVSSALESETFHTITLTLSGRTEVPVSVQVVRTGGTASEDDTTVYTNLYEIPVDNNNGGGILLINNDDANFEADETVQFQIVGASNAMLGSKLNHVYTILNDDPVSVQWQLYQIRLPESVTRPMIQVTLAQAMSTPVSVGVSVSTVFQPGNVGINASDGMNANNDYRLLSNRLYFAPGQTVAYLPLQIINDSIYEYDQQLEFVLTDPKGGIGVGDRYELDYFILNDDKPPLVSFARDWSMVREQNGYARAGELRLSSPSEVPCGVIIDSRSQTAHQGYDYSLPDYYNFSTGQVSLPVDVMLYDDNVYEPTRVVSLEIVGNYTDVRIGGRHAMFLLVQDNDPRPVARFQSSILIAQPGQELVPVVVELDRAASVPINITMLAKPGSTARYGVDYRWESPRTAVVAPGQTEVTFWIRLLHPGQGKSSHVLDLELISSSLATFKSGNTLSILIRDGN